MLVSLAIYLAGMRHLPPDELPVRGPKRAGGAVRCRRAARGRRAARRVRARRRFFWATYDQQGNTLLLWIEDHTDALRSISASGAAKSRPPGSWRSTR